MVKRQSKSEKQTVRRVMHEYKHGELESGGSGRKVKSPKQAIAIALSEAGASRSQSPKAAKRARTKTKAKERTGRTAVARKEGARGQSRAMGRTAGAKRTPAKRGAKR